MISSSSSNRRFRRRMGAKSRTGGFSSVWMAPTRAVVSQLSCGRWRRERGRGAATRQRVYACARPPPLGALVRGPQTTCGEVSHRALPGRHRVSAAARGLSHPTGRHAGMTEIVLFHSVLGVRQGVDDAVQRFWDAGHTVHVVDLYDGRSFDDYTEAGAYVESFGGPAALLGRTATAIEKLPSDVVYAGFSNGGGSALFAAGTRPGARGVLAFHAALPPAMFGVENWPGEVPVQVHYAERDPLRNQERADQLAAAVRASATSTTRPPPSCCTSARSDSSSGCDGGSWRGSCGPDGTIVR